MREPYLSSVLPPASCYLWCTWRCLASGSNEANKTQRENHQLQIRVNGRSVGHDDMTGKGSPLFGRIRRNPRTRVLCGVRTYTGMPWPVSRRNFS
jgi:hypothetical protein